MSIIRISMLRDGLYAPDLDGGLHSGGFTQARGADRRGEGAIPLYPRGVLPRPNDDLTRYVERSLAIEASGLGAGEPVAILVHGFMFDPAMSVVSPPHHHKADNPHARIYHFETHPLDVEMRHHSTSWPLGLGFRKGDGGANGLCVAFGWYSKPGFFSSLFEHGRNPFQLAYDEAEAAAWQLLCVIEVIARLLGRPVDVFTHSLGARVVLRALAQAVSPAPNLGPAAPVSEVIAGVDRVILLAGAEKVLEAQLALARLNDWSRTNGGARLPHFYNVISRERDVLDILAEKFGSPTAGSKQMIGHNGLERTDPSWVDIQFDDPAVAAWFKGKGYSVSGDDSASLFAVPDHWIHFTWPENMRVYHDMLRDRPAWDLATLKAVRVGRAPIFNERKLLRGPGALGLA